MKTPWNEWEEREDESDAGNLKTDVRPLKKGDGWTLRYGCKDCGRGFAVPRYGSSCPFCGGKNYRRRY